MIKTGKELKIEFFRVNGKQMKASDATLVIGVEGRTPLGINCGGCGFVSCAEMIKSSKSGKEQKSTLPGTKLCHEDLGSRHSLSDQRSRPQASTMWTTG